jgi:ATP-dependent protease HslVU (ClpYQ) peptidase subunit
MTCIVGLKHDGRVYIGGDSAASDLDRLTINTRADEKVFISHGIIFGFCSSFRVGQLIRYSFNPPEQLNSKSDSEYLVTDFIDGIRHTIQSGGSLHKENESEQFDSHFIIGYRNNVYVVYNDFQVAHPREPFVAVGSGEDLAMGAMYATQDNKDPVSRIHIALEAASNFNMAVRPPYVIIDSEGNSYEEEEDAVSTNSEVLQHDISVT